MASTSNLTHPLNWEQQQRQFQREIARLQRRVRDLENKLSQIPRGYRADKSTMDVSDIE